MDRRKFLKISGLGLGSAAVYGKEFELDLGLKLY